MKRPDGMKTVKDEAARLGITPDEYECRMDEAQAAIRRKTAALDRPGHFPESSVAKQDGYGGKWGFHPVTPTKGRPKKNPPVVEAVEQWERAILDNILEVIGTDRKTEARRNATEAAAKANKAKGDKTAAKVEALAADGKRPDVIAKHTSRTSRRVNQILAASKNGKSP